MPFTSEEVRSVDYMIESYNLSKETFVFSEENDDLFRRLFQDSGGSGQSTSSGSGGKYSYNKLDLSSLIMTLMKKNVFFVTSIDKEGISFQMLMLLIHISLSAKFSKSSWVSLQIARYFNYWEQNQSNWNFNHFNWNFSTHQILPFYIKLTICWCFSLFKFKCQTRYGTWNVIWFRKLY